jgi:ubiquinone/menaquinone biosynthesis C-methylase UbiE
MGSIRKPFQGVGNIIRFNWHYYVFSLLFIAILFFVGMQFHSAIRMVTGAAAFLGLFSIVTSLLASFYVYDLSDLYKLSWLNNPAPIDGEKIINLNAGFDETSHLLKTKFCNAELVVADFYDPKKHTEVSIKRARKAYPPFPGTQQVSTTHLPVEDNSVNKIFAILSAHEIRNDEERVGFFKELKRVLSASGEIIVTEHLRDTVNFLAYNFGSFHFHSKATWVKTFHSAGLRVAEEIKITPFITTFILEKNGTAS